MTPFIISLTFLGDGTGFVIFTFRMEYVCRDRLVWSVRCYNVLYYGVVIVAQWLFLICPLRMYYEAVAICHLIFC